MVFQNDDIRIDRIVEMQGPYFDALSFLPNLTPDMLEENLGWMVQEGAIDAASRKLVLAIQSYVVRTPHHTILIDSCVGNHKDRPTHPFWNQMRSTQYMDGLAKLGLRPEDIDTVLCTHLHVDHVGWNTRLLDGRWVPTFPNAKYVFAKNEFDYWNTAAPPPWITDSVLPIVAAGLDQQVAEDHAVNDYVRLESTPGHTRHHVAVQIGKGRTEAVMSGDLIHSPLQMRFPEIEMRADADRAQAVATRRRFLECYCETPTLMCTAHFPLPSTGHVARHGAGFILKAD